jgi:hypothetical protein
MLLFLVLRTTVFGQEDGFAAKRAILPVLPEDELAAVRLDRDVYGAAKQGLHDLRVLADDGTVVPFLVSRETREEVEWREAAREASVLSVTPGDDNRLDVVLRPPAGYEDAVPLWIELETPLQDFEKHVAVEVRTAGGREWRTVVADAVVFDYSRFMDVRSCRIPLPKLEGVEHYRLQFSDVSETTSSAFVEITTRGDGSGPDEETLRQVLERRDFRIDAVLLGYAVDRTVKETPVTEEQPLSLVSRRQTDEGRTTELVLDCGLVPITALRFELEGENFSRRVWAEVSRPDAEGVVRRQTIGSGRIRSIAFRDIREQDLVLRVNETRPDTLRVSIENGDAEPLKVRSVTAICPVYRLVFLARGGRALTLAYGNPALEAPAYDDEVLHRLLKSSSATVRTFSLEPPARPTKRPAAALWQRTLNSRIALVAVVVAAALVLAWAMWKTTRGLPEPEPDDPTGDRG